MWRTILIVGFFTAFIPIIITKPMYTLVHERAQLLEYDETVAKDVNFTFKKITKTDFAFNVTYFVLKDMLDRKITVTIYVDKMYGTQFKRTGTSITMNVCKLWEKNMFGMKDSLNENGHMEACDIYKGRYYTTNFVPDEKMFPRYLPFGSYRIEIVVCHDVTKAQLFRMYWFARVDQLVQ